MTRQNKILAATFFWGVSNLIAYHMLKHRMLKHIDGLNTQIDDLLEISTTFASDMAPTQLDTLLEQVPHDSEFLARLNNQ